MTNVIDGKDVAVSEKYTKKPVVVRAVKMSVPFQVKTLEGVMTGEPGDYLIEGIAGERYPCKPDIFEASYFRSETFLDRLRAEKVELDVRIEKLRTFFETETFQSLEDVDQDQLRSQLIHMTRYTEVLERRLARLS